MLNLLFPKLCNGCKNELSSHESIICTSCKHSLPLACHHLNGSKEMVQIFYGKFAIENATSILYFHKKGIVQEVLHNLKYRNQPKISSYFGKWLGIELSENKNYNAIDLVIPVPLHQKKLKARGYNQVEGFAKEIAKSLSVPYEDNVLKKMTHTSSQVFKKRMTRFTVSDTENAVFTVINVDALINKHVLLVDDIVTTGATLESCALQLLKAKGCKISIATIAMA